MMAAFANHSKALRMLYRHPLARSIGITTIGFAVSDTLCQFLEQKYSTKIKKDGFIWNPIRTLKFTTIGFLFGPQFHYWIPFVTSLFPGHRTPVLALKRVCFDQAIFGTWATTFALSMTAVLDGDDIKSKIREQWLPVYLRNCCIFPPGQFINYFLIPPQYRVLWLNGIGFIWRILLSYLVMGEGHKKSSIVSLQEEEQKVRESLNTTTPRR